MNRLVPVLAVALGIAIGLSFPVLAARDASGTFTVLNNGTTVRNPVTAGQVITKDLWNGTFADVGTEMTDSLSRSGKGAMLQPLKLVSGVAATPGLTFSDSTTSGLYYGASTVGLSVSTTPSQTWTAAGTAIPGTVTVTGAANLNGATALNGGVSTDIARNSGSLTVSAPAGVYLDTTAAAQSTGLMTDGSARFTAFDTYLDAHSLNIKNVLDPVAAQDAVTRAFMDARPSAQSNSGGANAAGAATVFTNLTNLSASITATGRRPVMVVIANDGANTGSTKFATTAASGFDIAVTRGGGTVTPCWITAIAAAGTVPGSMVCVDYTVPAGATTYQAVYKNLSAGTATVSYAKLYVSEM